MEIIEGADRWPNGRIKYFKGSAGNYDPAPRRKVKVFCLREMPDRSMWWRNHLGADCQCHRLPESRKAQWGERR